MFVSQISHISKNNILQNQVNKNLDKVNYSNVSFTGAPLMKYPSTSMNSKFFDPMKKFFAPVSRQYDKATTGMAKFFGKIVDNKSVETLIKKTQGDMLYSNLMTVGSVVLSGFYVKQTLNNDKLDDKKKRILALNQSIVWGFSTFMCYTFDKLAKTKINDLIKRFEKLNPADAKLEKYKSGIKIAASTVIFDMIYRFVTPVAVTPIANAIGNKIQEKKDAKLALTQAQKADKSN